MEKKIKNETCITREGPPVTISEGIWLSGQFSILIIWTKGKKLIVESRDDAYYISQNGLKAKEKKILSRLYD